MKNLIVVAHPDDESFFFGGRMLQSPEQTFDVLVITDGGHHDGETKQNPGKRLERLYAAAKKFGFRVIPNPNALPDYYSKRLDFDAIVSLIEPLAVGSHYDRVYTHSPIGDEGRHWHHQDVALAVSWLFKDRARFRIHGLNTRGDNYVLSADTYKAKIEALYSAYPEETEEFSECFAYFTEESVIELPFYFVWLLYAWHSEISFESKLMNSHPDFSDTWNMRQSPYENAKLQRYIGVLKNLLSGKDFSGIEFGPYLGLYSRKFLEEGIVKRLSMVEVCDKHYPDLIPLGEVKKNLGDFPPQQFDVAFFMEVVYYFSKEDSEKIIEWFKRNGLPQYLVFSNPQEFMDLFMSTDAEFKAAYKLIDLTEISSEFEYNFSRPEFLFRRNKTALYIYERCQ
jgi:LmbE family N-acetylglucosaminyl deacetylase